MRTSDIIYQEHNLELKDTDIQLVSAFFLLIIMKKYVFEFKEKDAFLSYLNSYPITRKLFNSAFRVVVSAYDIILDKKDLVHVKDLISLIEHELQNTNQTVSYGEDLLSMLGEEVLLGSIDASEVKYIKNNLVLNNDLVSALNRALVFFRKICEVDK